MRRAPVAQLDRVTGFEPVGRRFESCQAQVIAEFPMMRKKLSKAITEILIISLLAGCAHQSRTISPAAPVHYDSEEVELGEAIHHQILQTIPVYSGEKLNRYVQAIGAKLASSAQRHDLTYRFFILQDDRIYATHVPGGYVYITSGFFDFLKNESELAAVLAYEIAALQYKDPRLSKTKKAFELLLRSGSMVGPAFGSIGALSVLALALVGSFVGKSESLIRQVIQADRHALGYLIKNGYDPQGLMDLLHRVENPSLRARPYLYDYLQSHPVGSDRFIKLNTSFQSLPLENKQFQARRDIFLSMTEDLRNSTRHA